ncbi:hypothetical protein LKL35_14455 [Streptomyces sp. ET3-23]|uniref:hypothetical protein n=1 Tax=Streptomyces sp. ET3-23 TaxID=2885643 RepID=UPI001D113432|nr:hypothetical protein [Streptomyces sp. ET3-23]MCC2276601.1 hypothetical protein [Streptomyces sp. ET3-23]
MHDSRLRRFAHRLCRTPNRLLRWAAACRRAAIGLMLRGICYGTGTGLVSLFVYWFQRHG